MADKFIYIPSKTMEKRLFADLETGSFTDVTFDVGPDGNQRTFKAHRFVLASDNPEVEKLLSGSNSENIKIPDMNPSAFENLIRYCYGQSLLFKDWESIQDTYYAAEKFKIKELQLAAENKLIDLLKSGSLEKIMAPCTELNVTKAKERCLEEISPPFLKDLWAQDFVSVPLRVMEKFLSLCPDRSLRREFLVEWVKRHECPDIVNLLILMVKDGTINPEEVLSMLIEKGEKFYNELNFLSVPKGLFSNKSCPPTKQHSLEITNAVENTVSLEATDVKSSQVEHESLLEEKKNITDEVQVSGSKDKKEVGEEHESLREEKKNITDEVQVSGSKEKKEVVDRAETIQPEGEKMSGADNGNDSEDDEVIRKDVLKDFMLDVSHIIKSAVDISSRETVKTLIKEAERLARYAADGMQMAVDDLEESFTYLESGDSNAVHETEVKSE